MKVTIWVAWLGDYSSDRGMSAILTGDTATHVNPTNGTSISLSFKDPSSN